MQEILQAVPTAFCSKQKDGMMLVEWIIRLPPPQAQAFQRLVGTNETACGLIFQNGGSHKPNYIYISFYQFNIIIKVFNYFWYRPLLYKNSDPVYPPILNIQKQWILNKQAPIDL